MMDVKKMPETLLNLVKHYSPSGEEKEAVNYLLGRMQELGFSDTCTDKAGNAIGSMGDGPKTLILLGHIDTVPGEIAIHREGDFLYGRGTVDAKGPLSAFTDAVAALGPQPDWKFIVIGAVDEERDSEGARFLVNKYRPQMAIIGEPSDWQRITLGYKGSAGVEIRVQMSLKHSAGKGDTACEKAVKLWNRIQAWVSRFNEDRQKLFEQTLISLRSFNSDDDGFSERASLFINARLPEDLSYADWYASLKKICQDEAEVLPLGFPVNAFRTEKNSALVRAFLSAIRAQQARPGFVLKTGTADMNIVGPIWKCPIVAYGPGDSSLDHTPDEHIDLEEYAQAVKVLTHVIKTVSQSGSE